MYGVGILLLIGGLFVAYMSVVFIFRKWLCFILDQPLKLNRFEKWYASLFVDTDRFPYYANDFKSFEFSIITTIPLTIVISFLWPIALVRAAFYYLTLVLRQMVRWIKER